MPIINIDEKGNITEEDFVITPEMIASWRAHRQLEAEFLQAEPRKRWAIIRNVYKIQMPLIMEKAAKGYLGHINPYYVDWGKIFTPIEYDAWCSIRSKGIGLYPQFPALNYFIDFAHPYLKVGVELDGKDYHDPERDKTRDERLAEAGWRIFRIPGRECYAKYRLLEDILNDEYLHNQAEKQLQIEDYFFYTSDGVFEALSIVYFKSPWNRHYYDLAIRSLNTHRLAQFDI